MYLFILGLGRIGHVIASMIFYGKRNQVLLVKQCLDAFVLLIRGLFIHDDKMLPETSYIKPNNRSSDQEGCLKSWTLLLSRSDTVFFHLYTLIYFEIGQNVIYIQWLLHFHIISSVAHVNLHLHQFVVWAFVIMLCFINCINFTQSSTIGRFSLLYLFICVGGEGWDMFMQNLWWFAVKETKPCWLSGVLMHVHFSSWGCLCMMIRHVLRPAALNQTTYHFTKQVLGNLEPCFCFDLIHSF